MMKKVISIQFALMYQTAFVGSFEGILSKYKEKFSNISANTIPLPDDFPEDSIPRLEIKHLDSDIVLRFAKNRADIIFRDSNNESVKNDFIERIAGLDIAVGRLGFVQKIVYSDLTNEEVISRLALPYELASLSEVLEANRRVNIKTSLDYKANPIECNNISSLILGKEDARWAILLERDVNTLQSINLSLKNSEEIKQIFELLNVKSQKSPFDL